MKDKYEPIISTNELKEVQNKYGKAPYGYKYVKTSSGEITLIPINEQVITEIKEAAEKYINYLKQEG